MFDNELLPHDVCSGSVFCILHFVLCVLCSDFWVSYIGTYIALARGGEKFELSNSQRERIKKTTYFVPFGREKCRPKAQRCQPSKQIPALRHKDEKSAVASATAAAAAAATAADDDDGVQTCVKPKQQTDKPTKQSNKHFPAQPTQQ